MKTPEFQPTASIENLCRRAVVINRIRNFFEERGFVHVETPALSHDVVVDRYLDPVPVIKSDVVPAAKSSELLWLQTSPEFGMKRIVAAGATAIYQISRVFRAAERGRLHNPEFTMLEWYRVGDSMHVAMAFLGDLAETILMRQPTEMLSYQAAFQRHAGLDPHQATLLELGEAVKGQGITIGDRNKSLDRDGWLNLILTHVVEPQLGHSSPTIVYDWPASQAALANVREEHPPVAERFELYVDGIELANGYHELRDAAELVRRNLDNNRLRVADGRNELPGNSRLLGAMKAGLPDCCGIALGVDRLVMLALNANSIDEVIAFPIERA